MSQIGRESGKPDLRAALRRVRGEGVQATDAIIELRAVEIEALRALQIDVRTLIEQVPSEHRILFDAGLVPGFPPRLWIDILSFVEMAEDRETYLFLRDTRVGRRMLAEDRDQKRVLSTITDYVARRVIEREKALAEDLIPIPERRKARMPVLDDAPIDIEARQSRHVEPLPHSDIAEQTARQAPVLALTAPVLSRGRGLARACGEIVGAISNSVLVLALLALILVAMLAPSAG